MTDGVITRPAVEFDGESHTYTIDGEVMMGVSSVAKIGEAEDSYGIGSAWGFRLGYEGAHALAVEHGALQPFDVEFRTKDGPKTVTVSDQDALREALNGRKLTPWGQRDRAAKRGNWAHDLLEALAQDTSKIDSLVEAIDKVDAEHQGHARAILQWYIDFRPSFAAVEVQVASKTHGFAGRYDIRCYIMSTILVKHGLVPGPAALHPSMSLCLVDLKTSKRIYPTSHFVQLEGYEGASVEMGFPPTDLRLVLNTHPDGTYDFKAGYATYDDFLAYLGALRAIRRLKALDPEEIAKREREGQVLALLPALSRDIAGKPGMPATAQEVGKMLGGLRKRGLTLQRDDKVWVRSESESASEGEPQSPQDPLEADAAR